MLPPQRGEMKIEGNLIIRAAADAAKYADVTSVGESLYIRADGVSLPALTSVGGWLYIHAKGASLPALTSVGESLYISAEGASLPMLAKEHAFSTWSLRRHVQTGMWYAGCRGPFTTKQALKHWDREDDRARLFTIAIGMWEAK